MSSHVNPASKADELYVSHLPQVDEFSLPPRKVTVAATQMACSSNVAQNVDNAEKLVRQAAKKGAQIILLQELFQATYFCQEQRADLFGLASTANVDESSFLQRFARLSHELNVVLPISFFERAGNAHYNSIIVFDAGRNLGLYRKSHIPDGPGYQEKYYFNPGDTGFKVFHTQYGVIGVAICWDQWYPEPARIMALQGADFLFYPTAIGTEPQDHTLDSSEHWQRVMQGHSGANLVPVIASNRVGTEKAVTIKDSHISFYGHSFISGVKGELLEEADNKSEAILTHTFDINANRVIRAGWGVFRDRRPELYSPILSLDGQTPHWSTSSGPASWTSAFAHPKHHQAYPHSRAHPHHMNARPAHNVPRRCPYKAIAESCHKQTEAKLTTPTADGFEMPGEFEPHAGCWMLWPCRPGTYRDGAKHVQKAFADVASAIAKFEPLTMCVSSSQYATARAMLPDNVRVVEMSSDDAWARDIGPTFVVNRESGEVRGVDWVFNSWGGETEGCYSNWDQDLLVKGKILELTGSRRYKCSQVLEGGSIHVDGEGTLITTEECLLNPNRLLPGQNPEERSRENVEQLLKDYLGVRKIIWIPLGLYGDKDTDGHIDNIACFARPGEVVLAWTDDESDPQYAISKQAYEILSNSVDARGRTLKVHKLLQPSPIFMTELEADGLCKESKEKETDRHRQSGDRLAASYANFYIGNNCVIVPGFGDEKHDALAVEKLKEIFPEREVVQVPSREIVLGGGNIHCITQQQPIFLPAPFVARR